MYCLAETYTLCSMDSVASDVGLFLLDACRRRSSCAGTSPYAYQHDIPEILEFKKKVIRFLSEFAPQKLQVSSFETHFVCLLSFQRCRWEITGYYEIQLHVFHFLLVQENLYVERTLLKHRGHEKVLVDMLREQVRCGHDPLVPYSISSAHIAPS